MDESYSKGLTKPLREVNSINKLVCFGFGCIKS
jgi:hypothetical protein